IDSRGSKCLYGFMSSPAPAPQGEGPLSGEIQFERAEPLPVPGSGPECVLCKQHIAKTYYHAQGRPVCEGCATRIQNGQKAPPTSSLGRAVLFGLGAAIGCSVLYAFATMLIGHLSILAIPV